ncbi:hypothetical protein MKX03_020993 [Papaver bracteatum]|nr:hypothetical protein MKX03_020993 [Papaver bracteatum]
MSNLPEEEFPEKVFGLAAKDNSGLLTPLDLNGVSGYRATGDEDVTFKVMFCGICHSDLSNITNEWGYSTYPMVPGHEFVGIVTEAGKKVSKFKVGDRVGVGCLVGACHLCDNCSRDLENYCSTPIFNYNNSYYDGLRAYGGYSYIMVANERYVVESQTASNLMHSITVHSPMKYFGLNEAGARLGVVGLGGLGHFAVKFAKDFGSQEQLLFLIKKKKSPVTGK